MCVPFAGAYLLTIWAKPRASADALQFTLEYKLVAKRKGSLKKVATDLGASLTDPDDVRSSAAANPMLQKLHAGFEDMGDAP